MYAIVKIGAKQYRVEKDMILDIENIDIQDKKDIQFDSVVMSVDGETVKVGAPYVAGASVKATVLGALKGKKVLGVKFKKRKNYTRTVGARNNFLRVKINELTA